MLPETAAAKPGFAVLPYGAAGIHAGHRPERARAPGRRRDRAARRRHRRPRPARQGHRAPDRLRPGHSLRRIRARVSIALRVGKDGEPTVHHRRRPTPATSSSSAPPRSAARASTRAASTRSTSSSASQGAKIVIKPGPDDSDSFLATLLPGDGLPIGTDLTVGFSTHAGPLLRRQRRTRDQPARAHLARPDRDPGRDDRGASSATAASRSSSARRSRATCPCSRPSSRTSG